MRILVSTSARNVPSARKALVEKKTKLEAELAEINKQLRDLAGNDAEAAEAAAVKLVEVAPKTVNTNLRSTPPGGRRK